jgi:hypothetical protein
MCSCGLRVFLRRPRGQCPNLAVRVRNGGSCLPAPQGRSSKTQANGLGQGNPNGLPWQALQGRANNHGTVGSFRSPFQGLGLESIRQPRPLAWACAPESAHDPRGGSPLRVNVTRNQPATASWRHGVGSSRRRTASPYDKKLDSAGARWRACELKAKPRVPVGRSPVGKQSRCDPSTGNVL